MKQGEKVYSLVLDVNAVTLRELQQIRQLPDLRNLTLHVDLESSLDSLFGIVAELPRLEGLGLTGSRGVLIGEAEKPLIRLPESIRKLRQIRKIRLSDTDFDFETAIDQLAAMPNLRQLELNGFFTGKNTPIPAGIGRLTSLTELHINRQLTYLPPSIAELQHLTQLTITNQMPNDSGLAQVLPRLTGLERLAISFATKAAVQGRQMMTDVLSRARDKSLAPPATPVIARFPTLTGLTKLRSLKLVGGLNRMDFPEGIFEGLPLLDSLELTGFKISQPLHALCALQGLRYLNLNHDQLNELPPCIGQLKQLVVLRAEYDSLKTLPESLTELKALTQLYLSANRLQVLPEQLGRLESLRELRLSDNELTLLPPSINQLKQLQSLEVQTNQLKALPELDQLTSLRMLNVFDNQLTALPASLTRLTKLRTLVVLGNRLTELPADLGNLRLLHTLIIDQNSLRSLPESMGKLDSLQRLMIGENQLQQLPDGLFKLRNLRELYIGRNQLMALPTNLGALQSLESFNLTDNPIAELPTSVGDWKKLKTLTIQDTKIRLLPGSIGNWSSVTSINVDNNDLMALPTEIGQCRQLIRLSVRNANLLGLPESLGRLQQLRELIVSGKTDNQRSSLVMGELQKLPDSLAFCQQLTSIRINHQREFDTWGFFHWLPQLKNLQELDLSDCGLSDVSAVAWQALPLQRLVLSKNKLMQVPINLASGLAINWIDLSDNPLPVSLNQPFSSMEQLRTQLIEQAESTGTLPKHYPDAQLMRTILGFSRQQMEQRYWQEALASIDKAERFASDSLQALPTGQRAAIYFLQKDYTKAIGQYEVALAKALLLPQVLTESAFPLPVQMKTNNLVAQWWGNKGIAQGELGQYEQALASLQQGLDLLVGQDDGNTLGPLLVAKGRLLALTHKDRDAQRCFAKALDAFNYTDRRGGFWGRRMVRRVSGNTVSFLDIESIKRQVTRACLGFLTGNAAITQRELATIARSYSLAEIGVYGLIADYLAVCQRVVEGKQTLAQAKETLKGVLGSRNPSAEGWSFSWMEAGLSTMLLSAEKHDALRQLTDMVKERVKE